MRLLDHRQSADPRTDVDPYAFGIAFGYFDPGVFDGLDRGGRTVVDEDIETACLLYGQILADIEPLDLSGDLGRHGRGIKASDPRDPRCSRQNACPVLGNANPHRTDNTEPGNYDSAFGQRLSGWGVIASNGC